MKRILAAAVIMAAVAGAGLSSRSEVSAPAAKQAGQGKDLIVPDGLTRPSRKIQLALRVPGVLARRPVAEGDRVKAGQIIAELNSELEKSALEISKLKAESTHELQAAELAEKQSLVELGRVEDLHQRNMATRWELDEAKVKAEISRVRTEYAKFQRKLIALELARDQAALAERRLLAPFDGVIYRTLKEVGEGVQELAAIAELIQLDPLWVEVNVTAEHFGRIRPGDLARATVAGQSRDARVIMADPQVDAASSTFRVRLELANGDGAFAAGRPAGVQFRLNGPAATAPE